MNLHNLLLMGALLVSPALFAQEHSGGVPEMKADCYPAVYKSDKGMMQRVWVTIPHEGKPLSVTLGLGEQTQRVKLNEGTNRFYFEIPEVSQSVRLPLTLKQGKTLLASQEIPVEPVRHWQMNLVQHTHTDIGYTRSQMEILAEQLDVDADSITKDSMLIEDLGADSLDAIDIVMSVEDEFKIEVPDEIIEKIETVGDMLNYIENNI